MVKTKKNRHLNGLDNVKDAGRNLIGSTILQPKSLFRRKLPKGRWTSFSSMNECRSIHSLSIRCKFYCSWSPDDFQWFVLTSIEWIEIDFELIHSCCLYYELHNLIKNYNLLASKEKQNLLECLFFFFFALAILALCCWHAGVSSNQNHAIALPHKAAVIALCYMQGLDC